MSGFFKKLKRKISKTAERFAHLTADVIYDRHEGGGAAVWLYASLLKTLSFVFGAIARTRYWMYENRILRDAPLGCLVVVVGNLTVGGTGKTPIVEKFARALNDRGRRVAIPKPKVVSDGRRILLDSEFAGDEPYMLARNLPNVVVIVDKNRVRAGHYAITEFGADTLILDDGFQYLPLRGQLQLLLVDKTNPFGNFSLLPRGILREPVSHLKRASYIFLTKSDGRHDPDLERTIRKYNPSVEIIECAHRPTCLAEFHSDKRVSLDILKGAKVACFSAIAVPEGFEKFLVELGGTLVYKKRFLDHHRFDDSELEAFFADAKNAGAQLAVCTEKDAVRIRTDLPAPIPFYYTKLEIDILKGGDDFESAVEKICFPKRQSDK